MLLLIQTSDCGSLRMTSCCSPVRTRLFGWIQTRLCPLHFYSVYRWKIRRVVGNGVGDGGLMVDIDVVVELGTQMLTLYPCIVFFFFGLVF